MARAWNLQIKQSVIAMNAGGVLNVPLHVTVQLHPICD